MRDLDVRVAMRRALEHDYAGDTDTRIIEEMNVWSGSARVDLAVINGAICGYEIKSDRDTLARLPIQREIYGKVFDEMTLVVGSKHARKASEIIPSWWGLVVARLDNGSVALAVERKPQQNVAQDAHVISDLISKSEAIAVLDRHGLAKGWRGRKQRDINSHLIASLQFDILKREVREVIKKRPQTLMVTWRGLAQGVC